ncbi:hypothetical protein FRC07_001206 [Ceratobasidium sp. 392]|nr:hypothetical protein FRC07_001206 [Ceratobasidium sp. 392]
MSTTEETSRQPETGPTPETGRTSGTPVITEPELLEMPSIYLASYQFPSGVTGGSSALASTVYPQVIRVGAQPERGRERRRGSPYRARSTGQACASAARSREEESPSERAAREKEKKMHIARIWTAGSSEAGDVELTSDPDLEGEFSKTRATPRAQKAIKQERKEEMDLTRKKSKEKYEKRKLDQHKTLLESYKQKKRELDELYAKKDKELEHAYTEEIELLGQDMERRERDCIRCHRNSLLTTQEDRNAAAKGESSRSQRTRMETATDEEERKRKSRPSLGQNINTLITTELTPAKDKGKGKETLTQVPKGGVLGGILGAPKNTTRFKVEPVQVMSVSGMPGTVVTPLLPPIDLRSTAVPSTNPVTNAQTTHTPPNLRARTSAATSAAAKSTMVPATTATTASTAANASSITTNTVSRAGRKAVRVLSRSAGGQPGDDSSSSSSDSDYKRMNQGEKDAYKKAKREYKAKADNKEKRQALRDKLEKLKLSGYQTKLPTVYDGVVDYEVYELFMWEVRNWVEDTGFMQEEVMKHVKGFLKGRASQFYMTHIASFTDCYTLDLFFSELDKYCFLPDMKARIRKKFEQLRQTN